MFHERQPGTKKWKVSLLALLCAAVLVGTAVAATKTLYLRIRSAPVRSEPSLKEGDKEATVFLNQSFEVLEHSEDKDWVKVRFMSGKAEKSESKEGWVHATVLSEQPARGEGDEGCAWLRDGAEALPKPGSTSKERAKQRQEDLKAVLTAEDLFPSASDLDRFLKDGRLGLYRTDWPSLEGGVTE